MARRPTWGLLSPLLLLAALTLTFVAQYYFTGEWFTRLRDTNAWEWLPQYTVASACLLVAIALAGWASSARTMAPIAITETQPLRRAAWFVIAGAGICWLGALGLFLAVGENLVVQMLWVGSIALLAGGLWRVAPPAAVPARPISEYALVMLIVAAGAMLRFWELDSIPSHIDNDLPWVGSVALQLIEDQDYRWVGYSTAAAHLQSYVQFHAWSLRIFGADRIGLVISSAIGGTLTLPVVYLLGRNLYSARVGMIAMALLAVNYTHIHFSRTMFGAATTLFATLTFLLLFRGLQRREPIWFALGGLAAGIGLLLYDSSRVVPLVALVVLGWWLIWQRDQLRANRVGIVLFGVGILVGFGPMLAYMATNATEIVGRGHSVTIWTPQVWDHATAVYGVSSFHEVLWMQFTRAFLTFHLYGDNSPQFQLTRPMIGTLSGSLLVVGLGVALLRLRDVRIFSLLMWVVLTLVLGGVLTYDPPFWPHLNIALPAVMLIAAIGADSLISAWPEHAARWVRPSLQALLGLAIAWTALHHWSIYYEYTRDNAGPRHRMASYIDTLPTGYQVIMVSDEYTPENFAFRFFVRDVPMENRAADDLAGAPPALDRPLLFILHRNEALIPTLTAAYPGGELLRHTNSAGVEQFMTYRVAPPGYAFPSVSPPREDLGWLPILLLGAAVGWGVSRIARAYDRRSG
jgi:Dolichyl-phosphate-mannose-protein mannosyltransferase